jgi:hypothetical protein
MKLSIALLLLTANVTAEKAYNVKDNESSDVPYTVDVEYKDRATINIQYAFS